jgi:hypothetical protein
MRPAVAATPSTVYAMRRSAAGRHSGNRRRASGRWSTRLCLRGGRLQRISQAGLTNSVRANRPSVWSPAALAALGPLRGDLDLDAATDVLWLLKDPALYTALVGDRGWPAERYQAWLARTMQASLLPA